MNQVVTSMTNAAILSIETCFRQCHVSIYKNGKIDTLSELEGGKQTEFLLPAVQNLLKKHDLLPTDLNAVCTNVGPGTFTGIRVGISFLEGLTVFASNVKKYGVSALQAVAIESDFIDTKKEGVIISTIQAIGDKHYVQTFDVHLNQTSDILYLDSSEIFLLIGKLKNSFHDIQIIGKYNITGLENHNSVLCKNDIMPSSENILKFMTKYPELCQNDIKPLYFRDAI